MLMITLTVRKQSLKLHTLRTLLHCILLIRSLVNVHSNSLKSPPDEKHKFDSVENNAQAMWDP